MAFWKNLLLLPLFPLLPELVEVAGGDDTSLFQAPVGQRIGRLHFFFDFVGEIIEEVQIGYNLQILDGHGVGGQSLVACLIGE